MGVAVIPKHASSGGRALPLPKGGRVGHALDFRMLGIGNMEPTDLHERIKSGLSFRSVKHFQQETQFPLKDFPSLLEIPGSTWQRRKRSGKLDPQESDRFMRFFNIYVKAGQLFEGNHAATIKWLYTPRPALGGNRPVDLTHTTVGARAVEDLISQLEHGVFP